MFLKFLGIFVLIPAAFVVLTLLTPPPVRAVIAYLVFPILLIAAIVLHHVRRDSRP